MIAPLEWRAPSKDLNAYGHLAAVLAGKKTDQRLGRLVEAIDNIDHGLDLALGDPARQPRLDLGPAVVEIHDDEAFHAQPLGDDEAWHRHRPGRGLLDVVLRNVAATDDAAAQVHQRKGSVEHGSAGIVEIDVDAAGTRRRQRAAHAARLVVDGRIEAELAREPVALVLPARRADHAATGEPGDLADHRSHRAGRRRDQHRIAGSGLADLEQTEIGGEP